LREWTLAAQAFFGFSFDDFQLEVALLNLLSDNRKHCLIERGRRVSDLPLFVRDVGIGLLETRHLRPHELVVCAQLLLRATATGRLG
jgi:hypothetical protein